MQVMPRSLFGRLLATAGVALAIALVFAGFAIGHVLERFVMHGLDDRLDAQIEVAARAVRPDGTIDRRRAVDVPPFDRPGSGWAWEIRAPGGMLRSASLGQGDILMAAPPPMRLPRFDRDPARPRPFDTIDGSGRESHGRVMIVPTTGGNAEILAVGPRAVAERPLREAIVPLLVSLLLLGLALAVAILVQLRFGLRPLGMLRDMVSEVRSGRRDRIAATEPTELLPLIGELNAMIGANETALAQARGHVANLAHGLKTPLAALRLDLAETGCDPDGRLAAQVERIDRHVRHHLGRARAASPMAGTGRTATLLAPHVADIVGALEHIHADRPVRAFVAVPDGLAVRCDPQDLEEMLGNLLDNGWRWAGSTIRIDATRDAAIVHIVIADDGPGLADGDIGRAIEPGVRLDERGDGHGFGLSITRELAELYGGGVWLEAGPDGGLVARLDLPAA